MSIICKDNNFKHRAHWKLCAIMINYSFEFTSIAFQSLSSNVIDEGLFMRVFPQYNVHKNESQFNNFHYNTFFMWLFKYLKKHCCIIMQLKVDNILNSHYVVKLMHIWIMQWLIGVHFRVCHKDWNITIGLKTINFSGNLFMKVFTYKKTTIMSNLLHENFQFFKKTWHSY
jgi:hypothetical protein